MTTQQEASYVECTFKDKLTDSQKIQHIPEKHRHHETAYSDPYQPYAAVQLLFPSTL